MREKNREKEIRYNFHLISNGFSLSILGILKQLSRKNKNRDIKERLQEQRNRIKMGRKGNRSINNREREKGEISHNEQLFPK